MKTFVALILFIACATGEHVQGQPAAAPAGSAAPAKKAKKAEKPATEKENKSSTTKLFGPGATALQSNVPTTTEIYSDEAFFDSTKNVGIFSGRVKVTDPRFNLQSDKLTVFITKGENQGLRKPSQRGTLDWCATARIPTVDRRRAQSVEPIRPSILLPREMFN